MKTRPETMRELFTAWTQGGSPEIYSAPGECLQWLFDMQAAGEDIPDGYFPIRALSVDQLAELAAELCGMYETESAAYKVKPEYYDLWFSKETTPDPDYIITPAEIERLSRAWDTTPAELLQQLERVDPDDTHSDGPGYLYTVTLDHYENGRGHTYRETIESETAPEIFAPDFQEIRAESVTDDGPDAWTDITVTFYPLDTDGEPDTAHPAAVYRDGQTITGQH